MTPIASTNDRTGAADHDDQGAATNRPDRVSNVGIVSSVGEPRRVRTGEVAAGSWVARVGTAREPARPDADGSLLLRPVEALILARADG